MSDDPLFERTTYGSLSATPPAAPAADRASRRSLWPWLLTLAALTFAAGLLLSPWFETEVRDRLFGARPDAVSDLAARNAQQARAIASLQSRIGEFEAVAAKVEAAGGADPDRLDRLEARLDAVGGEVGALGVRVAGAVTGAAEDANAAKAVLLAAAARRAVESGQPLGALEMPLRALYGERYPGPVEAVVAATQRPVPLDRLRQDFDRIAPALATDPKADSGWWAKLRGSLAGIVTVRSEGESRNDPEALAALAARRLDAGDVGGAADLVRRLPGSRAATDWLADANRYRAAQAALAQLDAAALSPVAVSPRTPSAPATPARSTPAP